ncbi:MAG TPA: hypothetical protein VHQ22_03655 [Terriglobales bacterium]|nr:hypothetical protein [Terriglobales bacterium]
MRNHLKLPSVFILGAAFLLFSACSINVKKDSNDKNEDKKVDIDTPFGGIHVSKDADVHDTGLPVYPGAKPKAKDDSDDDEKSANVDISTSAFGLKVVALQYQSDASPDQVIAYYKDKLKQYGNVLECHTNAKHYSYDAHSDADKEHSDELKCEGNSGKTIELKAGRKSDQHIVAINPDSKGSTFALVYVRMRGKEGTI